MSSFNVSDRPPTYNQVLNINQGQLENRPAPHYPPLPTAPVVQPILYKFPDIPVTIQCQYCGQLVTTVVEEVNGAITFILCIVLILFCFFCGCCLLPFCMSDFKDKIHYCPKCQRQLGKKTLL